MKMVSRLVDFNINSDKTKNENNDLDNIVNVSVVNNINSDGRTPEVIKNAEEEKNTISPSVTQRNSTAENTEPNDKNVFLLALNRVLCEILATNNYDLLANIVDRSNLITLNVSDLCTIISLYLKKPLQDVHVVYNENIKVSGFCCSLCARFDPISIIDTIKIGLNDFKTVYNCEYNELQDIYRISMKQCIVNKIFTARSP
jgi:hypothetical protein